MGNTTSIFVQVSKPEGYVAGETVTGAVALNIAPGTHPIDTTGIQLEIKGFEKTSWTEHDSQSGPDGSSHDRTRYCGGSVDFFKTVVQLGPGKPGQLGPGQYQFGFTFQLPPSLPPSLEVHDGGDYCCVRYQLQARVGKKGMLTRDLRSDEVFIKVLTAAPPPQLVAQLPRTSSNSSTINCCCCFGTGSASCTVTLTGSNVSPPGGNIELFIEVENNSRTAFKRMDVILRRWLYMREFSGGGVGYRTKREAGKIELPGLPAHAVLQGQGGAGGARRVVFQVPPTVNCTAESHLITCSYTVEVLLKAKMCVSDLVTAVPVIIAALPSQPREEGGQEQQQQQQQQQQQEEDGEMKAPQGWNPSKVFDTVPVNLHFDTTTNNNIINTHNAAGTF